MASPAVVTLISSDDERFEVPEAAATMSQTIRHMIEDGCTDGGVPLPNVTARTLAKVLEYCNKHAAAAAASPESASAGGAESSAGGAAAGAESGSSSSDASEGKADDGVDLACFDRAFVDVDTDTLYDLLLAANYLNVKALLDLCCRKVADMIRGKSPEQIRQTFGIKNDFSPEEEEQIRKENQWAFEQ